MRVAKINPPLKWTDNQEFKDLIMKGPAVTAMTIPDCNDGYINPASYS